MQCGPVSCRTLTIIVARVLTKALDPRFHNYRKIARADYRMNRICIWAQVSLFLRFRDITAGEKEPDGILGSLFD